MTPMVGKSSVIAVLVGLALSPLAAKAQTDLWKFLTDQGVEAYSRGDFAGAAKHLGQALEEAESFGPAGPGNSRVAISLENLAALHDDAGAHDKAAPFYRRTVTAWEAVIGARDVQFATGKYQIAEKLYLRAIAFRERAAGVNSPRLIRILQGYAELLRKTARNKEAEEIDARIAAIRN